MLSTIAESRFRTGGIQRGCLDGGGQRVVGLVCPGRFGRGGEPGRETRVPIKMVARLAVLLIVASCMATLADRASPADATAATADWPTYGYDLGRSGFNP